MSDKNEWRKKMAEEVAANAYAADSGSDYETLLHTAEDAIDRASDAAEAYVRGYLGCGEIADGIGAGDHLRDAV